MHFFQTKNVTFTCITSTWYAQTRGKMNVFFEKTSFSLGKSMLFHAPDPSRHVNLVWRGNGKRKWTNSSFIHAMFRLQSQTHVNINLLQIYKDLHLKFTRVRTSMLLLMLHSYKDFRRKSAPSPRQDRNQQQWPSPRPAPSRSVWIRCNEITASYARLT